MAAKHISSLANVFFDMFEDEQEILNLAIQDRTPILNPVMLAVKYRAFPCLRYLTENFGVRPSIKQGDIQIRLGHNEYPFRQWLLPLLLRT